MSATRPLRTAALIPAPANAIGRALRDPTVWVRLLRVSGFRAVGEALQLRAGATARFRNDRPWIPRSARVHVLDPEGPTLRVEVGHRLALDLAPHPVEVPGAGVLVTVDLRHRTGSRRRAIRLAETLLGLVTVTAHDPRVVVAGMVVEGERVLGARRTSPAELAGLWELPGGKVEPGETEREALVRELHEELGVTARVGAQIGPEWPVGPGLALRAYRATLREGTPTARDHDEIRWFTADELDTVPWLPGDRPLMALVAADLRLPSTGTPT